jgi:hypothetical protein
MGDEIGRVFIDGRENSRFMLFFEHEACFRSGDVRSSLLRTQCGDARGRGAKRQPADAILAPALGDRDSLGEPNRSTSPASIR